MMCQTWLTCSIVFYLIFQIVYCDDEIWEQDMSDEFKIGLSTEGYHSVDMKCGSEAFLVNVTVDSDFLGVLYTRGDFSAKKKPCFYNSGDVKLTQEETKVYSLKIPFEKCHTLEDASEAAFTNILVLQHDPDLIYPGDAAFQLSCAFNPEQSLSSSMLTKSKSKIALVDADPASKAASDEYKALSDSDTVSFNPSNTTKTEPRDEL